MRDRLIELVKKSLIKHIDKTCMLAENITDDLLANGVIVPPKVIGEKVWYVCDGQVQFTLIEGVEPALRLLGFPRPITRWEIGTLIFLTREEAERALKGDKDINVLCKTEKGGEQG